MRAPEAGRQPVFALEWEPAAQQPEEDAAERVEVGRRPGRVTRRLFRRPVLRCPGEDSGDGRAAGGTRESRKAEVGHDESAAAPLDEDVRRCEISMDDAARVRVSESRRDRSAQPPGLVPAPRAGREKRLEGLALDELHHEDGSCPRSSSTS